MDNSAKKMYFPQAVFPMMEDGIAGENSFFPPGIPLFFREKA